MDEAGSFMAKLQSSIIVPIMYKMVHTGKLPKFMQKKINEADESRKKLIDGFVNMFGIDKEEVHGLRNRVFIISSILIWLRKSSMELMYREQHHVFYATKMGENTKRDIVLISKIRISEDITCSMKNCFAAIVQNG